MSEELRNLANDLEALKTSVGQTYKGISAFTGHGLRTLVASTKGEKLERYILLAVIAACGCSRQGREQWGQRWYATTYPDTEKPNWFTALNQFQLDLYDLVRASSFSYRALSDRAGLSPAKVSMMVGDETLCVLEDLLAVIRVLGDNEDAWAGKWHEVGRLTGVDRLLTPGGSLVLKIPSTQIIKLTEGGSFRVTVSIEKLL